MVEPLQGRPQALLDALPHGFPANRSSAEAACLVAARIADMSARETPPIIGINGAQGSGKSTLTELIVLALDQFHGLRAAQFSLDDFYLAKTERLALAHTMHPLCATRGVPGTHDMALMGKVIDALSKAKTDTETPIPLFDKLADDRAPQGQWPRYTGRPDVILLEGWCVGVAPDDLPTWAGPINALEAAADPTGEWLKWSLQELRAHYLAIWSRFALLVSIEVPGLDTVIESRLRQEDGLAKGGDRPRMDRAAVTHFVEHYERYTRALWDAMPRRADILYRRDENYGFTLIKS